MKKKGGSGNKPLVENFTTYNSVPNTKYGFLPGATDAQSNAKVFLGGIDTKQNNLNNIHSGGSGNLPLGSSPISHGLTHNGDILIPQFDEINPTSPINSNSASLTNNRVSITNQSNSRNDHYAFAGGKRSLKRKSIKRKSRKSRKSIKRKLRKSRKRKSRKLRKSIKRKSRKLRKSRKSRR